MSLPVVLCVDARAALDDDVDLVACTIGFAYEPSDAKIWAPPLPPPPKSRPTGAVVVTLQQTSNIATWPAIDSFEIVN